MTDLILRAAVTSYTLIGSLLEAETDAPRVGLLAEAHAVDAAQDRRLCGTLTDANGGIRPHHQRGSRRGRAPPPPFVCIRCTGPAPKHAAPLRLRRTGLLFGPPAGQPHRQVRWHYQWTALNTLLPHLLGRDVVQAARRSVAVRFFPQGKRAGLPSGDVVAHALGERPSLPAHSALRKLGLQQTSLWAGRGPSSLRTRTRTVWAQWAGAGCPE